MSNPIVTTATRADESRIASLITLAFANDPAGRRQYPDPLQYLTHFPEFVRLYGGKAFDHNCAHIIEGGAGAALWLPPGEYPNGDALNALYHRSIADHCKPELFEVFEQMNKSHPDEPHWFMPLIGVDPMQHGRGLGSALLYHGVTICDQEKKLAYLECTNSKNLPLYERHGFEVRGTIRVGEHPPVYPMLRRPRRGPAPFGPVEVTVAEGGNKATIDGEQLWHEHHSRPPPSSKKSEDHGHGGWRQFRN